MGKKVFLFLACMFMTASMAFAQNQTVSGVVTDGDTSEPLVGAAVKVEGTTIGALTDIDGKFTLKNLPKGTKNVVISYMGMETQTAAVKPHMAIALSSNVSAMNEVMVVAYGTATRASFTGSAGVVGSELIEKKVATNVTSALAGTTPGVQFMSNNGDPASNGPTIRIRGIGSISSSNTPLYVVDGVPYDGPINAINPQDVESMTVLKDASASAIYGARGANGVILITTKKGRDQKMDIKFDAKWGSNGRLIPQYDVIKNAGQYYEMMFNRLYNTDINSGYSASYAYQNANKRLYDADNGGLGYQVFTVPEGQNLIGTNLRLNPNATLGYTDGEYYYRPDDWYNEAFHNSFRQEYNVSMSNSTDRLTYYAGAGFLDDNGIVNNSGMKRYNGRLNAEYQARPWMKVTTNMNFTHTDSDSPSYTTTNWASSGNMFYIANNIAPIYPLYVRNADGTIKMDGDRIVYDSNQTNFKRAGVVGNAIRDNEFNHDKSYRDVMTGVWGVAFTPVEGLSLSANLGVTSNVSRNNYLGSVFADGSSVDGYAQATSGRMFTVNNQYLAEYKTNFGETKHNFDIMAGYEQYKYKYQYVGGYNDHLFNPFVGELNNAKGTAGKDLSSYTDNYMTEGILSRLQYDYDGKYFLSASYRRDASSRFAPGHRWGNFGSVGAAWLMNKESFLENAEWIDMLKFKASYGIQGNDNLLTPGGSDAWYAYADMYSASYNEDTGEYSTAITQKGNNELTWETSHAINVGFDFNLFKNRLNGSVEYFVRKTSDLLFYKDFPLSSGFGTSVQLPTNIGSVMNHGIEVNLDGVIIRNKDLEWTMNANLTHYRNKILELDPAYKENGIKYSNSILREGGSIYQTYMYKYAGVNKENGAPLYYKENEDGSITTTSVAGDATKFECGTTLPKVYGGFGTNLSYKGFDLSAQFSYQLGGKIYDGTYQSLMWTQTQAGQNMHKDLLKAWTPQNTNTDVPLWKDNMWGDLSQSVCDYFLTSSNYLSINNITLGYTLPKQVLNKANIGALRVYIAGENLAVFSKRQGLDPRFTTGLGSMTSGSGRNGDYYSAMRSIVAGLNLTF